MTRTTSHRTLAPLAAAALLTLLALLTPPPARADSIELAKRHYKLGEEMFNRADYAGAIEQFKAAYKHSNKPALLYNIARCQESLGQHAEAIKTYERYLESNPSDAEQIKARIVNLRRLVKPKQPPAPPPATTPPVAPPQTTTVTPAELGETKPPAKQPGAEAPPAQEEEPPAKQRRGSPLWGFVTAGAGGALLITGVVLGAVASSNADRMEEGYRNGEEYGDLQPTVDAGEAAQTGQIITLVAGSAALVAGAVLLYLHYGRGEQGAAEERKGEDEDLSSIWVAPAAARGGAYLGGGFSF